MSSVKECHSITHQLHQLLFSAQQVDDHILQRADSLLQEREVLLPNIVPPFTDYEKILGAEMNKWNQVINLKMRALKGLIQRDINGLNKTKVTAQKYSNPYESMQTDGMFYDKRN
ncbi:flagellar protein FliT [Rossellomorea marisflavi]|uniref:flagellar protein FliT n=1 Tax=Rossellomorea marisflavi TaxID=189381 RepID=UPI00296EEB9C|nr:flagellar protein FliT [Rossellomorea marisflavi]MDW4528201.1 flagellar protein FliT [Rossellomorea marisflavi]